MVYVTLFASPIVGCGACRSPAERCPRETCDLGGLDSCSQEGKDPDTRDTKKEQTAPLLQNGTGADAIEGAMSIFKGPTAPFSAWSQSVEILGPVPDGGALVCCWILFRCVFNEALAVTNTRVLLRSTATEYKAILSIAKTFWVKPL